MICTYLSCVIWKQSLPLWYQQYKKLSQTWDGCHWRPWQSTWFAMGETSVYPVYKTAFIFSKIMLKMFNLHHVICRNLTWRNEQRSKYITEMDWLFISLPIYCCARTFVSSLLSIPIWFLSLVKKYSDLVCLEIRKTEGKFWIYLNIFIKQLDITTQASILYNILLLICHQYTMHT